MPRIFSKKNPDSTYGDGRTVSSGYVMVSAPGHPRAHTQGNYVFEHILIAERALGKFLPKGAVIHHVDGDKANNAPNNLVICQDNNYHRLLHIRTRGLKEYGNVQARKCVVCKQWDMPKNLLIYPQAQGKSTSVFHRNCRWNYDQVRRQKQINAKKLAPILIAERVLGKPLPDGAQVHHVDGNRANNANTNLVICQDQSYRLLLQRRAHALKTYGDPNARTCGFCHQWDSPDHLIIGLTKGTRGDNVYHKSCRNRYVRERRALLHHKEAS